MANYYELWEIFFYPDILTKVNISVDKDHVPRQIIHSKWAMHIGHTNSDIEPEFIKFSRLFLLTVNKIFFQI